MHFPSYTGVTNIEQQFTSANTVWDIVHDLNAYPAIEVFTYQGGVLTKAQPLKVEYPSLNEVKITWTIARTGLVRLIQRQ